LRHSQAGADANRRLPVFLQLHRLRHAAQAQTGRLLRVLLLRVGALPAGAGARRRRRLLRAPTTKRWPRMKWHALDGRDWMKAIGAGIGVSILTAAA
jgi:hypothetical protein